jgi:NADH-quinone oxidoreductase subunit H
MGILKIIYYFLITPGFLFTAVNGLISTWIDRKITARLQWRRGPGFCQPFADILKLLGKETFVPDDSKLIFVSAPLIALIAVTLVSTMLWILNINSYVSFAGDLIVIILLLTIPSIALIMGGSVSKNPLSTLGINREKKLLLSYELPFIIAILTVAARASSILTSEIISQQAVAGMNISSFSGAIAFIVSLLVAQAQLGFVPFDIAEAEQEIEGGPLLEYSGSLLAVFKLTKVMLLFTLPVLLITLFMGGIDTYSLAGILWFLMKYVFILTLIILIKNTNPRIRIDQAVHFFLRPMTVFAIIGFILAIMGL